MQLTPEQVNEFIAKAVLDSQIGEAVQGAVKRVMEDLRKNYNNPFDEVVKRHISQLIDKEVMTTYKPTLEAGIKAAMAEHMTGEVVEKIISSAMERLKSRY
jgi:uncharacterized membrane-anchored protein YjiN (DUF445 family)